MCLKPVFQKKRILPPHDISCRVCRSWVILYFEHLNVTIHYASSFNLCLKYLFFIRPNCCKMQWEFQNMYNLPCSFFYLKPFYTQYENKPCTSVMPKGLTSRITGKCVLKAKMRKWKAGKIMIVFDADRQARPGTKSNLHENKRWILLACLCMHLAFLWW